MSGYVIDLRYSDPRACANGGSCRCLDAGQVPWRRRQSVAEQGNTGGVARTALAVSGKAHAEAFTDPCAHFQGRIGTRGLEAGHYRPFPDAQGLPNLSVVGRSWAKVARGRSSGSRGVLHDYVRVDESEFQLLSSNQHWLSQQLRQGERPRRHLSYDPRRLLVERLLCDDRRANGRDLLARP